MLFLFVEKFKKRTTRKDSLFKNWIESKKRRAFAWRVTVYVLLVSLGIVFSGPMIWLVSTSLKVKAQIFIFPPKLLPDPVTWANYTEAIHLMSFWRSLQNSLIIACGATVGMVLSCSVVGYSFARLEWPGRDYFFIILLGTMMLPYVVTLMPLFVVFAKLGWVNTFKPLIVPAYFGSAFYIFLLRQFFLTIPRALSDSAEMDGCSEFRIFWNIILPLCKPALAVVAIFTFMASWRDFMGPLIYLGSDEQWTLALSLHSLMSTMLGHISWTGVMAGSVMTTIPIMILFFFTQKQFIRGVVLTGIKG